MGTTRRIPVTVATTFLWLLALAAPASAHTVEGVGASNFLTRLTEVAPAVPGIDIDVVEHGARVQLRNTSAVDAVVLGYQDEPYLRVGPDGVFENTRSPATYLNRDRRATEAVPGDADPEAEPEWRKVSDGQVARWHDHRAHWMGEQNPPEVRRAPGERHVVIPQWQITVRVGDTDVVARGELLWVPGPGPWGWVGVAAVLVAVVVAATRTRAWRAVLAVALAALVAVDVLHAVGVVLERAGSVGSRIGDLLSGSYVSIVGWVVGIAGVVLLARRRDRDDGLYAAAFAGVFIAVNGGLADLSDLSRSQVPFAGPAGVARAVVAVTLGLGVGLLAASAWRVLAVGPPSEGAADAGGERADDAGVVPIGGGADG